MRLSRFGVRCVLTVMALALFTGSAVAQGIIIHLVLEDDNGSLYSITPGSGWSADTSTCFDFRIEDIEDPCNPLENFSVLYFGDARDPQFIDTDLDGEGDVWQCDDTSTCRYNGLAGGSSFTTAIDLRDFAPGTPITFYPAYALRTDGSGGDVFEMFARVNLEGEGFQKIASNTDPSVTQLFDFGTETVEPITLPSNAAGNEINIQFSAISDGDPGVPELEGPTGFSVGRLEFVGTAAQGSDGGGNDTTAPDEWFIPNSGSPSQGWTQITAGASPLNPNVGGFYFGNPANDDYCDREDRPSEIYAGPVDLTDLDDTVVLSLTYGFQTNDSPAEDLVEIQVNVGNSTNWTAIASSDPNSPLPRIQNDGQLHVINMNLPAGTGGNFVNFRVSFMPDNDVNDEPDNPDSACGTGLFISETFALAGGQGNNDGGGTGGSDDSSGGGGGGSGCFIATAAYGTPVAEDINVLRDVRDAYLMDSSIGLAFVDAYYRLAPPIADVVAQNPTFAAIVRAALVPVILLSKLLLESPVLFTALTLLAAAAVVARRRGHLAR